MKKTFLILVTFCAATLTLPAQNVIRLAPERGDMTNKIQTAIEKVKSYNGRPVIIELQNADYHIYRESSSHQLYHISNTTSEQENPNQTKHIGLCLKNLQNLTIDGKGARIITHGEITGFAIDQCKNIQLKNMTITAADPTVPELTVTEVGEKHMNVRIHPQSKYVIENGQFSFIGHHWKLSKGIAQIKMILPGEAGLPSPTCKKPSNWSPIFFVSYIISLHKPKSEWYSKCVMPFVMKSAGLSNTAKTSLWRISISPFWATSD